MKNETLNFSIWYSQIYPKTFVPSLQKESKHIESFYFHSWKETPIKDILTEYTYSIVHDEYHGNGFTITSGNSIKMIN